MAVIVSEPHKELVGGGDNAKYVKECTEMYLGGKGIEKIRGFEPFVNLESLWLNNNKLKKLNNLDVQKRLKALYAQDNQLCTLKGSLQHFKFLETLDLSNNQLRDLEKQLRVLEKFKFIKDLNLKGNPMCEEPDYRLLVVHSMPALQVLDQHVITPLERRRAAGMIGGDVATLTVAFGCRVPQYDPAWDEKVPERSPLEQQLIKEAATIRDTLRHEAYMRERGMFLHDPHPEVPRGPSLPPNAGTVRAMQVWRQQQLLQEQQQQQRQQKQKQKQQQQQQQQQQSQQQSQQQQQQGEGAKGQTELGRKDAGVLGVGFGRTRLSGSGVILTTGTPRQRSPRSPRRGRAASGKGGNARGSGSARGVQSGRKDQGSPRRAASAGTTSDGYLPRDKLVLYTMRAAQDPLATAGSTPGTGASTPGATSSKPPPGFGSIRFQREEYEQFLSQRAAGSLGWEMSQAAVLL
ncbi:hypothetical protein Agub_g4377 [Astrephomene gubernaculifera]|uniref:Leucine rich repeat protein n=1 Tax=Astrephomene gubernaculifera TaxID=47775 RepID=A0AAD3HK48_9CHLO|nr:hypothetical protein Agub_g4377 [Astrephomene gubernaculifera]